MGSGSPQVKGYSSGLIRYTSDEESFLERVSLALCTSALSLRFTVSDSGAIQREVPWRTVESLGLFQEPLKPTAVKLESLEFFENASFIDFGVVSKLSTFYEREDDRVLEAVEDRPNPV